MLVFCSFFCQIFLIKSVFQHKANCRTDVRNVHLSAFGCSKPQALQHVNSMQGLYWMDPGTVWFIKVNQKATIPFDYLTTFCFEKRILLKSCSLFCGAVTYRAAVAEDRVLKRKIYRVCGFWQMRSNLCGCLRSLTQCIRMNHTDCIHSHSLL